MDSIKALGVYPARVGGDSRGVNLCTPRIAVERNSFRFLVPTLRVGTPCV
jgi:hypothetical protein